MMTTRTDGESTPNESDAATHPVNPSAADNDNNSNNDVGVSQEHNTSPQRMNESTSNHTSSNTINYENYDPSTAHTEDDGLIEESPERPASLFPYAPSSSLAWTSSSLLSSSTTGSLSSAGALTGEARIPPAPLTSPTPSKPSASSPSMQPPTQPQSSKGSPSALHSSGAAPSALSAPSAKRLYRSHNKWVTRDIAALDFLLGIPLETEAEIVHTGYLQQQRQHHDDHHHGEGSENTNDTDLDKGPVAGDIRDAPAGGRRRWWEKIVKSQHHNPLSSFYMSNTEHGSSATALAGTVRSNQPGANATEQLEEPTKAEKGGSDGLGEDTQQRQTKLPLGGKTAGPLVPIYAPGRRLEGDAAVHIQIPLTTTTITKQRSIARQAALREWELQTAHGLNSNHPPMLDNRIFFSALGGYPMSVFSMIRYEPKKEEAALRRQKLEARGGGGSQFVIPPRDWRGISYRALLPRARESEKENKAFNRFLRREHHPESESGDDSSSTSSSSSDESDAYVPGLLDDPEMVLGRHRNVMVGDRVTGPIIASTIQFVEPALLKAELNKQFRERFDGWEPPKSARKFIGARVSQGKYLLMDPTEDYLDSARPSSDKPQRSRQGSVTSMSSTSESGGPKEKQIRMPPSLTLSKIRSLKHQALEAAVEAKVEVGTVALACVYFERLCLDCRVDKSNRRLTFAACLLLASKLNEPNSSLVIQTQEDEEKDKSRATSTTARIQSLIRPNKRSNTMFASLLEFFTEQWQLSLKHLFDAEWGVFVALGFSLLASPSQVAFHYRRMMKTLEWNPRTYLGEEMYNHWQDALEEEDRRRTERERRKELLRHRKEQRIVNLHLELESELLRRKSEAETDGGEENARQSPQETRGRPTDSPMKTKKGGIKLLHRFGMRRSVSQERIDLLSQSEHKTIVQSPIGARKARRNVGLPTSPSLPALSTICSDTGVVAIDIPEGHARSETSSIESVQGSDLGGINV